MDLRIELIFSDTERLDRDRVGEIKFSIREVRPVYIHWLEIQDRRPLFNSYDKASCTVVSARNRNATRSRVAAVVGGRH